MHLGTCWLWSGNVSHVLSDTRVTAEWHTCYCWVTRVTAEWHVLLLSDTRVTAEWHTCYCCRFNPPCCYFLTCRSNSTVLYCTVTVFRLWNVPVWCSTCKLECHRVRQLARLVTTETVLIQCHTNRQVYSNNPKRITPSDVPAYTLNFGGTWPYAYCLVTVIPCRQVHREQNCCLHI
jgi:hypothetical protein